MKNLHLLPTDNKPSRLYFNVNDKEFQICEIEKPSTILKPNRHIYITNDEEIKEGDWFITTDSNEIHKSDWIKFRFNNGKKIILTTDQDLIKDGVQEIDDEFLEWFVKNPSCEEVEIGNQSIQSFDTGHFEDFYKIIIPKEEPKPFKDMLPLTQVELEDFKKNPVPNKKETPKQHLVDMKNHEDSLWEDEPKQETLEEAEKEFEKLLNGKGLPTKQLLEVAEHYFVVGYEIAKERSYSEEEVFFFIREALYDTDMRYDRISVEEWFEQFKKK